MPDLRVYEHAHRFHVTGMRAQASTLRVVFLTVAMMVVEIVAGWFFNSMALLADGCHMSTHAAALGIAWAAFGLARKHAADHRFVFGTWKIEVLGGFTSAILLGFTGFGMAVMSVMRLMHPTGIQFNQAILVAVIGLVVNLVSVLLLQEGARDDDAHEHGESHAPGRPAHASHAHAHGNLNMRAAYLHVLADALTSVLAIAALVGGKYLHWMWLDPAVGLVGAAMIAWWAVQLITQTGGILLDRESDDLTRQTVCAALEQDGATRVSDLHVWRVGQGRYACIVTVVSAQPQHLDVYKQRLDAIGNIVHATVEIVPALGADPMT